MSTMLQVEAEIDGLAEILVGEGVTSYLEIGSKFGGSLLRVAERLPVGSRIVSVDLPKGTKAWVQSEAELKAVIAKLRLHGYDAHLIWGDSTAKAVVEQVRALGPFDAAFIDANHTLPYVEKDFANYALMTRIIAFHDIAWRRAPEWVGTRIDVPEFWARVKDTARQHAELKLCPTAKNNGIGVLWLD
ncbi:class I SAM-dependent methyltransferase [Mesorhizobium sp. M7A.F.Ce.TU.012.03.2.1]|uniref:class I SAM-dependent methyltransferase n=1 Tax=Mesorhizobium sp. M7A.F.Ce.TU.012.03.2.1 TaxID=2493681 RepID=UPI001FE00EC8|nr:class I SAM-dependent methyltransferase [Mesorhizobium sp. M7A.F.Ce.TU.012.03.2.1]